MVKADRADPISTGTVAARQVDRVLGIDDVGMDLQHLVDPLESDRGALTPGDRHAEHAQRAHEQGDVEVELDELAEREVAVDHLHAAEAEHGDQAELRHQFDRRQVLRPDPRRLDRLALDVVGLLAQLGGLHALGAEALDDPHPTDGLLDHGGEIGLLRLHGEHGRVDRLGEPPAGDVHERQGRQGHDGEQRVGDQQDDGDGDDHRRVRQRDRDHHDEALDLVEIARRPAHQLAGLRPVVVADVQRHDVAEQLLAQAGLGPARFPEGVEAAERRQCTGQHAGDGHEADPEPQVVVVGDAAVDPEAHEDRHGDLADHPEHPDRRADDQVATLGAQRGGEQRPLRARRRLAGVGDWLNRVGHARADSRAVTRSFGRPMIATSSVTTSGRCRSCLWASSVSTI